MTRVSLAALILVAIGAAVAVALQHWHTSDPTHPPSPENKAAWEWVAAEPGVNLYVSPAGTAAPGSLASVWINREFFRSPASVGGNVVELEQFDCGRRTSRRLSVAHLHRDLRETDQLQTTGGASAWSAIVAGTAAERVLFAACGTRAQRPVMPQEP
jgi:hypothetical protein